MSPCNMYSILFKKLWANVYVNIGKFLLCRVFWRLLPFHCTFLMYVCARQDALSMVLLGKSGDSQELAFPFCGFLRLSLVTRLAWQVFIPPPPKPSCWPLSPHAPFSGGCYGYKLKCSVPPVKHSSLWASSPGPDTHFYVTLVLLE